MPKSTNPLNKGKSMSELQDVINLDSTERFAKNDSIINSSDIDESFVNMLSVEAEITPELIEEHNSKQSPNKKTDIMEYCIPKCSYERKEGGSAMCRCCLCMRWYHLSCVGDEEEDGGGFWSCTNCRYLPEQIQELKEYTKNRFDTILMKMNDMHHVNTRLLPVIEKNQAENKLLKIQLNEFIKNYKHCNIGQVNPEPKKKIPDIDIPNVLLANQNKNRPVQTTAPKKVTDNTMKQNLPVKIICDSIPKRLDTISVGNAVGSQINIVQEAQKVNDAIDHIQDCADNSCINVIHTGTLNLKRDSTKIVIQRIERMETNIKDKKLQHVAISSIVHRFDIQESQKIIAVNRAIKQICRRNQRTFIDNDNMDRSCLWRDGLHLNQIGKQRLAQNIINLLSSFPSLADTQVP